MTQDRAMHQKRNVSRGRRRLRKARGENRLRMLCELAQHVEQDRTKPAKRKKANNRRRDANPQGLNVQASAKLVWQSHFAAFRPRQGTARRRCKRTRAPVNPQADQAACDAAENHVMEQREPRDLNKLHSLAKIK
jgi:hypothetical protein